MTEKLFTDFPPVSTQQWEEQILRDLKGADYEKKLVWKTLDGFKVRPYYRQEDLKHIPYLDTLPGVEPFLRGTRENNDWLIRQSFPVDGSQALFSTPPSSSTGFKAKAAVKESNVRQSRDKRPEIRRILFLLGKVSGWVNPALASARGLYHRPGCGI